MLFCHLDKLILPGRDWNRRLRQLGRILHIALDPRLRPTFNLAILRGRYRRQVITLEAQRLKSRMRTSPGQNARRRVGWWGMWRCIFGVLWDRLPYVASVEGGVYFSCGLSLWRKARVSVEVMGGEAKYGIYTGRFIHTSAEIMGVALPSDDTCMGSLSWSVGFKIMALGVLTVRDKSTA